MIFLLICLSAIGILLLPKWQQEKNDMKWASLKQDLSPEMINYLRWCSIPNCGRRSYVYQSSHWYDRPLCRFHYNKVIRHGHPLKGRLEANSIASKSGWREDQDWHKLGLYSRKFGMRFKLINAKPLGKNLRRRWVAVPYHASGPRSGSSRHICTDQLFMRWKYRGWVIMEETAKNEQSVVITQRIFKGKALPGTN